MKLSRILAIFTLLIMIFNLVACDQLHFHTGNRPDINTEERDDDKEPEKEEIITYVYSVTQKVLHLPDCYHIENMNEDYKFEYSGDISVLFEKGFTICRDCLGTDSTEEDKVVLPDPDEVPFEQATYVINRSKLTIHKKDCHHVDKIAEKNLKYTCLGYEELIANKHVPCGFCMPDEYEAYKEANPDKFKDND